MGPEEKTNPTHSSHPFRGERERERQWLKADCKKSPPERINFSKHGRDVSADGSENKEGASEWRAIEPVPLTLQQKFFICHLPKSFTAERAVVRESQPASRPTDRPTATGASLGGARKEGSAYRRPVRLRKQTAGNCQVG